MWTLFFIFLHIRKTVEKPLIFTKRLQYILLPGALTPYPLDMIYVEDVILNEG